MKRFSLVLALAFVLALGAMASAYPAEGIPLPEGATEVDVFRLNSDGQYTTTATNDARAWNSGISSHHCNRACHGIDLTFHVSVAQWIDYEFVGTRKDWRVLKPGTYASNSWSASIKSNNDVEIVVWAENPSYLNPDAESPPIKTRFGTSTNGSDPNSVLDWADAFDPGTGEANKQTIRLPFDMVKNGVKYHIWQEITVTDEHRSSEYEGKGYVEICITNQKMWVDEGGKWIEPQV